MNDLFDRKRFSALAARHYAGNWKFYLFDVLGTLCALGIIFVYAMEGIRQKEEFILMCALMLYAVQAFVWINLNLKRYTDRQTRIGALTLPASVLEKYAFAWFNAFVVGTVLFLAVFYAVGWIYGLSGGIFVDPFRFLEREQMAGQFIIGMLLLHVTAFFCRAAFRRRYVVAFCLVVACAVSVNALSVQLFYALTGVEPLQVLSGIAVQIGPADGSYIRYVFRWAPFVIFMKYAGWWIAWGALFVAGYFKLKERQVNS